MQLFRAFFAARRKLYFNYVEYTPDSTRLIPCKFSSTLTPYKFSDGALK